MVSKLVKTKTNSKYFIGYLDKDIRPLVLIMPKMRGYVKTFKVEDKINKLISFHIDDEKLLEKYKTTWIKIENLKNIELNALPVSDDRYIKTKIRALGDKVCTNFRGLMWQKMTENVNLLRSFLLILCLYAKTNITCKYI